MLGALGAPSGSFSPLLGHVFPGSAVSPSLAALLYWVYYFPPREPVGPAGLCEQELAGRCLVPGPSGVLAQGQPGCLSCCARIPVFGPVCPVSPVTDLGAHPPKVSGVGTYSGFNVWLPRLLIEVFTHSGF